jgi:hypothetical protein
MHSANANLVRVGRDPGASAGSTRASVAIGFGSPAGDTGVTRLDLNDNLSRNAATVGALFTDSISRAARRETRVVVGWRAQGFEPK